MRITDNTVAGDIKVTVANPSVYEAVGRAEFLRRALATSDSRIEGRRLGAGLNSTQVANIRHLLPSAPAALTKLPCGQLVVIQGPLGAGKSDVAEVWFRASTSAAGANDTAPLPIWVSIDELESSLEVYAQREVGLHSMETLGADIVVDGLDERTDRAQKVIQQADALVARWPRSRVVLTSRAGHGVGQRNLVQVPPLSRLQAKQLVSLVAGVAHIGDMNPEIEEAIERPLFALLVGQQATTTQATTMTEVIEGVVRKVVGSETLDLYTHLCRLAVETVTTGRVVDPEALADFAVASQLRHSPFLTVTSGGVTFSLATFEQWFAARAVMENVADINDLLTDLGTFDRWKYVLSMILASGEPTRVDPIMAAVARWNPGAMAWIINETEGAGLARAQRTMSENNWLETGTRLRVAIGALLDGLGPLAGAFGPFRWAKVSTLDHLSVIVETSGTSVTTIWLISNQYPSHPLPPVVEPHTEGKPEQRSIFLKRAPIPLARNWVWAAARNILRSDLSESFTDLAIEIAAASEGIVQRELLDSRERDVLDPNDLESLGRGLYGSLYPLPDVAATPPKQWPGFSVDAIADRIHAVTLAAIACYVELSDRVTPRFGDTLEHRAMMPFEYYGNLHYSGSSNPGTYRIGPSTAGMEWLLRPIGVPLPNGERAGENSVNLTVNDDARSQEIEDNRDTFGDAHFAYFTTTPGIGPFVGSFSITHGRFDLVDKKPATHMALSWLWSDLMNLKWVRHFMPPDRTR